MSCLEPQFVHCLIVPEEGWFGQPKYHTPSVSSKKGKYGTLSEWCGFWRREFSFQWCDWLHDMLNRSPLVGLWRYKRNIIYYVTEEITSLWLAEDRSISIVSLGRLDYQLLFREMSPHSSKGGTQTRESGGNQSSLHPRDRSPLLGTELRKADRTVGWTVIYFPIFRQARLDFFRECLQLRRDVTS